MKRAASALLSLLVLMLLAGCASTPAANPGPVTSGVPTRAFVSNAGFSSPNLPASALRIVNFHNDTLLANQVTLVGNPQLMALSPNRATSLVFDAGVNELSIVDNNGEIQGGTVNLPDATESMVILPDSVTAYVAVPNAPVSGQPAGVVEIVNFTSLALSGHVNVPNARRLALSHNGKKLLVFSDGSNDITVINTADNTTTTVTGGGVLDQPVGAVFTSDDSIAFVLSCGPECGGAAASVTPLTMAGQTLGVPLLLPGGATVGFLNGSTLYVAGSCGAACPGTTPPFGRLTVVNTSGMSISATVPISDGYHDRMEMTGNNKLYIGARNAAFSNGSTSTCSNATQGCLSMFNISGNTAVISAPQGVVTGMAAITGRNVVYVCVGGELVIYDTTTDAPQAIQIDIVGQAYDVKQIDQ